MLDRTEVAINDDSVDMNFRVASDNLTHALFVQGSDGNVGIGVAAPLSPLHVESSTESPTLMVLNATDAAHSSSTNVVIESTISLRSNHATLGEARINHHYNKTVNNNSNLSFETYNHTTGLIEGLRIDENGWVGIGTSDPAFTLDIEQSIGSDGDQCGLLVSGTGNSVKNQAKIGVLYDTNTDSNQPVGFIMLDSSSENSYYYFTGDDNNFYTTDTVGNVGKDASCTLVAGQSSDERLKNISSSPFPYGLTEVNALSPIKYTFKKDKKKRSHIGFGAQTTQSIIPESVKVTESCVDGYDRDYDEDGKRIQVARSDDRSKMSMEYVQIIPVLVKAIQELSAKVEALEKAK